MSEALGIIALAKAKAALSEIEIQAQINDRIYEGVDLTVKFATEIVLQYGGDAWAWIKARIQAGNFAGVHVGDWIPFTTTNNYTFNAQIAGINTYKGYGDIEIGYHIDFICKELWINNHRFNNINYNNGVIPVELIVADGETTEFVLTKPMIAIDSITNGSTAVSEEYTYNPDTYTITFTTAPAAATLTVTGTGTECPWLASDMYLWVNSKSGVVPNSTGANPDIARVDYTRDGIYYYLPTTLKNVIVEKQLFAPTRYSSTGFLTSDNNATWAVIGKLWLPSEVEMCGIAVMGANANSIKGTIMQYPLFNGRMNSVKKKILTETRMQYWLMTAKESNSGQFCVIGSRGNITAINCTSNVTGTPICFRIA